MYLGRIVEIGTVEEIFADPKHPYTQALLRAIPEPDPTRSVPRDLPRGEVPDAARPPLGCSFHPRCPKAFEVCGWESRDLRDLLETRWAQHGRERVRGGAGGRRETVDSLDVTAAAFRLEGRSGTAASRGSLALLERMRDDDPDEPFWRGVRACAARDGHVDVEFVRARRAPASTGRARPGRVHLYDDEAVTRAPATRR